MAAFKGSFRKSSERLLVNVKPNVSSFLYSTETYILKKAAVVGTPSQVYMLEILTEVGALCCRTAFVNIY